MLMTIDVGNTNITIGLYRGQERFGAWRLRTVHERMPDEYGLQMVSLLQHIDVPIESLEGVVLASVVPPLTTSFVEASRRYLQHDAMVINADTRTGLEYDYDNPAGIGADRIVDAVAVLALYGAPACVVDFGTATTFDAIDSRGRYLGGAIAPGIGIAADALFQRTAKLPRVGIAHPPSVIGRNTEHAIQSGLLFGYVGLVEGIVTRFRRELGSEMKVIGTGGLVSLIATETDVIEIEAPWLTLDGLRMLWEMNA